MKSHVWFYKKIALMLVLGMLFSPAITFAERASKHSQQKRNSQPKRKFTLHNFDFEEAPLATIIRTIADLERINVIFEDAIAKLVETKKVIFVAKDVSAPRALEMLLDAQRFS